MHPPPFLWGDRAIKTPGSDPMRPQTAVAEIQPIQVPRRSSQPQEAVMRTFFNDLSRGGFSKSPREKALIQVKDL